MKEKTEPEALEILRDLALIHPSVQAIITRADLERPTIVTLLTTVVLVLERDLCGWKSKAIEATAHATRPAPRVLRGLTINADFATRDIDIRWPTGANGRPMEQCTVCGMFVEGGTEHEHGGREDFGGMQ